MASGALRALTAAALALPGVTAKAQSADDVQFTFEVHHYQEGERNLDGQKYSDLNLKPLQADSVSVGVLGQFVDRVPFTLNYSQDTWSGATPVTTVPHAAVADQLFSGASSPSTYYINRKGVPVAVNWDTFNGRTVKSVPDTRLVHIMASASPETRRQIAATSGYEWDDMTVNGGGGISEEPDYHSAFFGMNGSWDFNGKLTTASWGWNYTTSSIDASLEANSAADWGAYTNHIRFKDGQDRLFANRHDASVVLGLSQILNRDAVLEGSVTYARSTGYLSNPYKATLLAFDDPQQIVDSTGLRAVAVKGVLEQRPRLRDQWTLDARYVQYVEPLDASLHVDYRFYHDDWAINAHTLDVSWYQPLGGGWMAVPDVRYYTQTKAYFYQPFFLFNQAFPILLPRNPELPPQLDHSKLQIQTFSSDERLSAFGSLSGGLAVSHDILDNAQLELGIEYTRHAGSLHWGSGGEGSYANFHSLTYFASLEIAPAAREADSGGANGSGFGAAGPGASLPAGVRNASLLSAGQFSLAYRFDYGIQNHGIIHGAHKASDSEIADKGCEPTGCTLAPADFYTQAHALEFRYAPTDWLTLTAVPGFLDTHMDLREVNAFFPPFIGIFNTGETHAHSSGGVSDTELGAVFRLFSGSAGDVMGAVSLSAPTGSVNERLNGGHEYLNYAQQLGSGTWDVRPGISFAGSADSWWWGAQASETLRLSRPNDAGYALGNLFEATGWAGYDLTDWLSGSVRGIYTAQAAISGQFKPHTVVTQNGYNVVDGEPVPVYLRTLAPETISGPMESPQSYGGRFFDMAFGLAATVPDGRLAGNRFSFEWLEPVRQSANGYQLRRTGTLSFRWDIAI